MTSPSYQSLFELVKAAGAPAASTGRGRLTVRGTPPVVYLMDETGTEYTIGPLSDVVRSYSTPAPHLSHSILSLLPGTATDGDVWIVDDDPATPLVPASGFEIDVAERSFNYDIQGSATPTTLTAVDGLEIVVPPQSRSFRVIMEIQTSLSTGTAAAGLLQQIQCQLTDYTSGTDVMCANDYKQALAGATTGRTWNDTLFGTRRFPPSTTTRLFRVLVKQVLTTPLNWGAASLTGGDPPNSGVVAPMTLTAVGL